MHYNETKISFLMEWFVMVISSANGFYYLCLSMCSLAMALAIMLREVALWIWSISLLVPEAWHSLHDFPFS